MRQRGSVVAALPRPESQSARPVRKFGRFRAKITIDRLRLIETA